MNWELFVKNVKQWAEDRNLIKGSTVQAQALKGLSEFGELADNLSKGSLEKIKDDIGDNCVVAVIVDAINGQESYEPVVSGNASKTKYEAAAAIAYEWHYYLRWYGKESIGVPYYCRVLTNTLGIDFEECLAQAWDDIKDRKGIMHNGVFVKSTDSAYEEIVKLYAPK